MEVKMSNFFCKKSCNKYGHLCTKPKGHKGKCSHGYLSGIVRKIDEKIGNKLKMDTYMTPGNKGAAKNRADRCYPVQYSKKEIWEANKKNKVGICIPKRFSSTPEDCFEINVALTSQILAIRDLEYNVDDFKGDEKKTLEHMVSLSSIEHPTGLRCRICNEHVDKDHFYTQHGVSGPKSAQLGHINPTINGHDETAHVSGNTQWIHRDCNIIQGEKTEEETFRILAEILKNQGYQVIKEEVING